MIRVARSKEQAASRKSQVARRTARAARGKASVARKTARVARGKACVARWKGLCREVERPVSRGERPVSRGERPVSEFLQLNTTHRILVDFQLIPRT